MKLTLRQEVSNLLLSGLRFLFLFVDLRNQSLDILHGHNIAQVIWADNEEINALLTLNDFKQSLNSEPDGLLLIKSFPEVFLKVLSELLRLFADRVSLPLRQRSGWLCQEHLGSAVLEATQESRDSERTHAAFLGVLLLCLGDELGDVLNAWGVFV